MKLNESPSRIDGRVALAILAVALLFSTFVRWRDCATCHWNVMRASMPMQASCCCRASALPARLQYETARAPPGLRRDHGRLRRDREWHPPRFVGNKRGYHDIDLLPRQGPLYSLAGGIAAAAYSLLAVSPSVLGTAAHATHFVTFFSVAAAWALWRALRSDKVVSAVHERSALWNRIFHEAARHFPVRFRRVDDLDPLRPLASAGLAQVIEQIRRFLQSVWSCPMP